jgi:hypothetical protein
MGEQRSLHPAAGESSYPADPSHGSVLAPAQQSHSGRRLRILCLHGFRQSARSFEGRTHALRRRLKDLADLVFIDAPHELPAWDRQQKGAQACTLGGSSAQAEQDTTAVAAAAATAAAAAAAARRQQHAERPQQAQQHRGAPAAKRAWLLVPEQYAALQQAPAACCSSSSGGGGAGGSSNPPPYASDPGQYERQTAGWQQSQAVIGQALEELGPFDGVLGLSQGAAVAAVLVAQQWQAQQDQQNAQQPQQDQQQQLHQQEQTEPQERPTSGCCCRDGSGSHALPAAQSLQFAVLCSGYRSRVPAHARLLSEAAAAAGVALPSLHIFGGGGGDRQISTEESAALAGCFHPAQRTEGRHSAGHLIPSSGPVLAALREFLQQQQQRLALGQRPDQQCKLPK